MNNTTTEAAIDGNTMLGDGWNLCSEVLPPPKAEYGYSEQCLVWYVGEPNVRVEGYGIAYYNYEPPFQTTGMWVDFAHYGRQPIAWKHILPPSIA